MALDTIRTRPPDAAEGGAVRLAQRERYTVKIRCKRCGTVGGAILLADKNTAYRREEPSRELLRVEGKFRAGIGRDPHIYCDKCGRPARM